MNTEHRQAISDYIQFGCIPSNVVIQALLANHTGKLIDGMERHAISPVQAKEIRSYILNYVPECLTGSATAVIRTRTLGGWQGGDIYTNGLGIRRSFILD